MKYCNVHTGEVTEWTEEIGPEGKVIMVSTAGMRWVKAGTPGVMMSILDEEGNVQSKFVKTPSFLSCHKPA